MSDEIPPVARPAAPVSQERIPSSDVDAVLALLDYVLPEVGAVSETAATLLRLARRAIAEERHLR